MITLPQLPYPKEALAPYLSAETLEFHYGKHHQAYVDNLNKLIPGTEYADLALEQIVKKAPGAIFNNASQVWNHTFYFNCLRPRGGGVPAGELGEAINKTFGRFDDFKQQFTHSAVTLFGSGWAWLSRKKDGTLHIIQTSNAGNPMTNGETPLLACDVWEHAYYIDYRNARAKYVENFWNMVNWGFAAESWHKQIEPKPG